MNTIKLQKRPQIFTKQNNNITSVTTHILGTYILMQTWGFVCPFFFFKYKTCQVNADWEAGYIGQYKNKSRYHL